MKLKNKKSLTMTVHIPSRGNQPLSSDERNQLTEFFTALMDLDQNENITKGKTDAKTYKRDPDNTN